MTEPPVQPRLLLASANLKKLKELRETATQLGVAVLGPADWLAEAAARVGLPEVDEDGDTFVANGLKKALSALRHARAGGDAQLSVLADDSGLCVDALGGHPGVFSARYAGPQATDADNRAKLLQALSGVANRAAWFNCTLVLAGPLAEGPGCGRSDDGFAWRVFTGRCDGTLLTQETGDGGFGYDPLFFCDALGQTFAEAPAAAKHTVSHRGRAMAKLASYLKIRAHGRSEGERKPLYLKALGLQTLTEALKRSYFKGLRYADQALEQALGQAPALGSKERQAVAELHWHALRRLDHLYLGLLALRGATKPTRAPDPRTLPHNQIELLALLTLADLDPLGQPRDPTRKNEPTLLDGLAQRNPGLAAKWPYPPVNFVTALRTAAYAVRELIEPDRLALTWGFHPEFAHIAVQQLGAAHAELAMAYLNQRGPLTLRANARVTQGHELAAELARAGIETAPIADLPGALWTLAAARVTTTEPFLQGRMEIQDEGSQRIAAAVHAQPGELIIDWCAGAGGKTLALANAMQLGSPAGKKGRLIACDTHPERLAECTRRTGRAGIAVETRALDRSEKPFADLAAKADAVLVDAPCSSSGALRRNPELRWHLDAAWLSRFPAQQLAILRRAAQHVRPGGRLIYATCSLMPAENEHVVADFLAGHSEFEQVAQARIGPADFEYLTQRPLAQFGPDGFYWCALRRRP